MKKIMRFSILNEDNQRVFELHGDYEIMPMKNSIENRNYKAIDFRDISAVEIVNGKAIEYKPTSHTFAGTPLTVYDIAEDVIRRVIFRDKTCQLEECCKDLQQLFEEYMTDSIEIGNDAYAKYVLVDDDLYFLCLVTEKYVFYSNYESMILLDASNGSLISDNYFAEVGFEDTLEEIKSGKQNALWMSNNVKETMEK